MLSSQEEQQDRQRVLENDKRLREQGGTFHAFADAEARTPLGRFSAVSASYVVGSTAIPQYPAAAAHQRDPVPPENALGYRIDEMPVDPSMVSVTSVEDQGGAEAPLAASPNVEPAPSLSSDDPTTGGPALPSASPHAQRGGVGSSPFRLRRF
jgi:hypothetical protein